MTKQIKILLLENDMTITELANKLGCTPQNLSGKFKRDNFTENELRQIADILGYELKIDFIKRV